MPATAACAPCRSRSPLSVRRKRYAGAAGTNAGYAATRYWRRYWQRLRYHLRYQPKRPLRAVRY
eukprot:1038038-Rhodomonas_salina.1